MLLRGFVGCTVLLQIHPSSILIHSCVDCMIRCAYNIPCFVGNADLRTKDAVNAVRSPIKMYEQTKLAATFQSKL